LQDKSYYFVAIFLFFEKYARVARVARVARGGEGERGEGDVWTDVWSIYPLALSYNNENLVFL
jgi:hypothetical protein